MKYLMPIYICLFKILRKLKLNTIFFPILYLFNIIFNNVYLPNIKCAHNIIEINRPHKKINNEMRKRSKYIYDSNNDICKYDLQIIVPVYNSEKYIKSCLNSILQQRTSYKFRIIVINDGSTDNTNLILNKYNVSSLINVVSQRNLGRSAARNTGLSYASDLSNYIMFVDSDDKLAPGAIQYLLEKAYKFNSDISFGGYNIFNNKKEIKKKRYNNNNNICINSSEDINGYLWGKVFKIRLFNNIYFPVGYEFEDTILSFLIYPKCKSISSVNENVYFYRNNPKSISHTFKHKNISIDSYLITKLIIHSLYKHDVPINQYIYNTFLIQVKINCLRNIYLDINIQKSIFVLTCKLFSQYFSEYHTTIKEYKPLERSLINKNYNNYLLSCTDL